MGSKVTSRAWLIRLVTLETMGRALLGYGAGVGLAYASAAFIMARWPQFSVLIQPRDVWQSGVLALGMSLLASWLPIRRLEQIDPVQVFKA